MNLFRWKQSTRQVTLMHFTICIVFVRYVEPMIHKMCRTLHFASEVEAEAISRRPNTAIFSQNRRACVQPVQEGRDTLHPEHAERTHACVRLDEHRAALSRDLVEPNAT